MPTKTVHTNGDSAIETPAPAIQLTRLKSPTVTVPISGTTELIMHKWSEKAKRMMLEAQMTRGTKPKKEPKNPQEDYESTIYRFSDGRIGFPASGFKAAIVGACRHFDGLPMTKAKIAIFVEGDEFGLVPIVGVPYKREDMVRLESGVADIRFRAGFPEWSAKLHIKFVASVLSAESVVALVEAAGLGGIGDWRPSAPKSSSGSYGMFEVTG